MQTDSKKKMIKKSTKVKRSNAHKSPINAYFFFLIEQKSEFKTKYPNLKPEELVKKVYEKWLELDITEKEKYQTLANAEQNQYLLAKNKKNKQ